MIQWERSAQRLVGLAQFFLISLSSRFFLLSGIANRAIRPLLGIVDPLHTRYMPERVAANSGFDVLW